MQDHVHTTTEPSFAFSVELWERVFASLQVVCEEARSLFGTQLRHSGFAASSPSVSANGAVCEITTGRSSLRFECRFSPAEDPELCAVLDSRSVACVHVWRLRARGVELETILAAEPERRRWFATNPPTVPAPLDDARTLQAVLWTLLGDPP